MQHTGARRLRADDYKEISSERHLRAVRDADSRQAAGSRFASDAAPSVADPPRPLTGGEYVPTIAENGRRAVTITGHPVPPRRRAPVARSHVQARPDRIALWAFLLGLFLVFMAVATANAAAL